MNEENPNTCPQNERREETASPRESMRPLQMTFVSRAADAGWSGGFQCKRAASRALTSGCDEESGAHRVLTMRPRGLEASSRYSSVWMTLDHMRTVNGDFTRLIVDLTQGRMPPGRASAVNVKSRLGVTSAIVAEYEQSSDDLLSTEHRRRSPEFEDAAALRAYSVRASRCGRLAFAREWGSGR